MHISKVENIKICKLSYLAFISIPTFYVWLVSSSFKTGFLNYHQLGGLNFVFTVLMASECFKKCKGEKLTDLIKSRLLQIKPTSILYDDERMPKVICDSCRKLLPLIIQGKKSVHDLPSYDFSIIILKNETRRSAR